MVVALWGMGGIGKTALARKVYHHPDTKKRFDSFAWVCAQKGFRIRKILEDVAEQLTNSNDVEKVKDMTDTELMAQLCEIQRSRRCLVVIDDLWIINQWEGLKHAFLVRGTKSKILLTTRNLAIAHVGYAFKAGLLTDDEGLELLNRRAFPRAKVPTGFQIEEDWFEKVGKEMVRKCGNLPLAISLLGGVLRKKESIREWELVKENVSAYLYRDDYGVETEVNAVMKLSYEDLPSHLKPCFLDLGHFAKGNPIWFDDICLTWIAHGMISQRNEENLLDIAHSYLIELISRCLVEINSDRPVEESGWWKLCILHDVVWELCLCIGKQESFGLHILDYDGGSFGRILNHCLSSVVKKRHLVVNFESVVQYGSEDLESSCDGHTVRSLYLINWTSVRVRIPRGNMVDLMKFTLLRDLILCRIDFEGRKLPEEISNLIHLRKFGLTECELEEVQASMGNLLSLYCVSFGRSEIIRISSDFLNKLTHLRHLILPDYKLEKLGDYPRLSFEGIDELESLVGFTSVVHQFESIIGMKELRRFEGTVHDNDSLMGIIHAFSNWKKLTFCTLQIGQGCDLSYLSSDFKKLFGCPVLRSLQIYVPISNLLMELGDQAFASNLTVLKLYECEIEEDPMEILGKLPLLEVLTMGWLCFRGEEMTCHASSFPSLLSLQVLGLRKLKEWRVERGAMPLVGKVVMHSCFCLKMIPDGFRFLSALTDLQIVGMPQLGERVAQGGEDFDKVKYVPSISIRASRFFPAQGNR